MTELTGNGNTTCWGKDFFLNLEPLWQQIRAQNLNECEQNPFDAAQSTEIIWSNIVNIMVHDIMKRVIQAVKKKA